MRPDQGTLIRMIFFILSWANAALANAGYQHLPLVTEEGVAVVVAFAVSVWAYWKNNNHTKAAQNAQVYLNALKSKD